MISFRLPPNCRSRRFRLFHRLWLAIPVFLASYLPAAQAATPDISRLTLDRIFGSDEFKTEETASIQWRRRRAGYTTLEKPAAAGPGRDLVWNDPATGRKEVLVAAHRFTPPDEENPLSVESYAFSEDESKVLIFTNSKRVWRTRSRGDYWALDIATGELKKLGGNAPPSSLMFAKFSPDAESAAFVRDNDLYVQSLRDLKVTRLTTDGSPKVTNGTFDWVYEEELMLHDGYRWSPDSESIAYWQIDGEGVREFPLVKSQAKLYPTLQWIPYPKVGEQNPAARIGVVSAAGGPTRWLKLPGDPREHYLSQLDWAGNSSQLILQQFNRLQNTSRLFLAESSGKKVRTVLTETDEAWVENSNQRIRWVDDHKRFIWLSERDGWQHAYSVNRSGNKVKLLTPGPFDVISIEALDEKRDWLYFMASPDNPTQRYLYRTRLDGTKVERVTPAKQPGTHTYNISPDANWAVHTYSTFDSPPVVDFLELPEHKTVRVLAANKALRKKLAALAPTKTELFRVEIGDDVKLDGWCRLPADFDEESGKKYPVVFHVYGEPAGQTVVDRWGGKQHLWHQMLAQQGYVVISIDNRGTAAPRGREWRKCVYKQVGILASSDQAAATLALLKDRPYLDPKRVGIWGWSGGGSMTLNALFRYPELYRAGISIAPVPNQRFYDTIYQERYMGLPGDNAEGYRLGSPINFAHQLRGELLLVHGTGDDNCHYQGSEALIHELVAHNKQFQMFAYPGRSHSISEGKNTTRHLFGLLTDFLHKQLPPGPVTPN